MVEGTAMALIPAPDVKCRVNVPVPSTLNLGFANEDEPVSKKLVFGNNEKKWEAKKMWYQSVNGADDILFNVMVQHCSKKKMFGSLFGWEKVGNPSHTTYGEQMRIYFWQFQQKILTET